MEEDWDVASGWNAELNLVVFSRTLVELLQTFSQTVRFYADDGILGRVEGLPGAAEEVGGYLVLVKLIRFTLKVLCPEIKNKTLEAGCVPQDGGDRFQLAPFLIGHLRDGRRVRCARGSSHRDLRCRS